MMVAVLVVDDLGVGEMPDHIEDYSNHRTNAMRVSSARGGFENTYGLTKFGSLVSGVLALANPVAGMLASFAWDGYSTRKMQPGETYAEYAGRMKASNASLGPLGSVGLALTGAYLRAPRGAVKAGELLGDAVAGAPPGTLRAPGLNMQNNDSRGFLAPKPQPANQQPANTTPNQNYTGLNISGFLNPKKFWG